MAITARIQITRSARRTALRAARQERCASATRSSTAVSPVSFGHDHSQHGQRTCGSGPATARRRAGEPFIGQRHGHGAADGERAALGLAHGPARQVGSLQ